MSRIIQVMLGCSLLMLGDLVYAQDIQQDAREYFDSLERVNRYSPIDGAGSHGGLSAQFGIGAGFYSVERATPLHYEQLNGDSRAEASTGNDSNSQLIAPRLYVLKGIVSPIDVGLIYGRVSFKRASQLGAHVQWTLYEGFQMPAVSIRGHFSRVFGLYSSDFQSSGIDGVLSFGFLRYFTVFGGLGFLNHTGSLRLSYGFGGYHDRGLTETSSKGYSIQLNRNELSKFLGLHLQVIPAFMVVAFEGQEASTGLRSFMAKAAFGI